MAKVTEQDIVFMSSRDWDSLPLQTHFLAEGYARCGHRVFFINQTLQKWPKLSHLAQRLRPSRNTGQVSSYSQGNAVPNVIPITLWAGPPARWLRWLNRIIIRRTLQAHDIRDSIFVTWVPTFTALDIIDFIRPIRTGYVNHHNFDADAVLPDLLLAERQIAASADYLFADSLFLRSRMEKLSAGRHVHRSMPGVYYERFKAAERGDEIKRLQTIYYFGEIGTHLNLQVYNELARTYSVVFIGVVSPAARKLISPGIEVRPPLAVTELPQALRDADILTAIYRDSPYMRGVLPAKFFECLATGKPLLVSGIAEAEPYRDMINIVGEDLASVQEAINNLPLTETQTKRASRDTEARRADWNARFEHFRNILTPDESSQKV